MSSTFYNSSSQFYVKPDIRFVMQDLQALSEYTNRVMSMNGWSLYDVRDRAVRAGYKISHTTVANIISQTSQEVKSSTITALAHGLDVSPDELFAIVNKKVLDNGDLLEQVRVKFHGWDVASDEDKADTLSAIALIAEGFQRRRRRKKPPDEPPPPKPKK